MKQKLSLLKNKNVIRGILAFVIIGLFIGGFIFYEKTRDRIFIDNSLINAPIITIAPITTGKFTEIDVAEGQTIKKGDTLAVVNGDTLRADSDGLVIMANDQTGGTVTPQTQLIQMIHPAELRVAGTIDENKGLNTIHVGQVASFTVDAFPGKTYWGYIDEISPSAKQTQLSFSISSERPTQQFVVYAKFDHTKYPEIKNGMSAKMAVYTATN